MSRRFVVSVTELVANPDYDAKEAERRGHFVPMGGTSYPIPSELQVQALTFTASEEQFNAIRKAALEAM